MRLHHGRLRRNPLIHRRNKQQPIRHIILAGSGRAPRHSRHQRTQRPQQHRDRRIQHAHILPEDTSGGQRVQGDGAGIAGLILHQGAEEMHGAVVQRAVVGVVADAGRVEGEEDVNGGGGWAGGAVRDEGGGQQRGDVAGGPGGDHAVGEAGRVVDDEDVGFAAEAELEGALLELSLADVAEAVGVSYILL